MSQEAGWTMCLCAALFGGLSGCASDPSSPPSVETTNSRDEENLDPTAMHLHDVAGRLLLFCAKYDRLPAKLEDLEPLPGDNGKPSAIDPATGEKFTYTPDGLKPKSLPGRVIAYQAVTKSRGSRWALLFNDKLKEARVQRVADSALLRPLD